MRTDTSSKLIKPSRNSTKKEQSKTIGVNSHQLVGAAAAVALFLLAFPLPLRVDGNAVVTPAHMAHLGANFEGVIRQINVREGDVVKKGAVIANLED